ncbi:MAG: shikimate kinase [Lachnospiraceae bacterium]|nr:shikimate kinase [Lachnospiraceae bacterium]
MKSVILIGYMGCGKSTVGRKLSYRLRKPFLDTDKQIEMKQKCTISEIFEKHGEKTFRDMETEYLRELLREKTDYVIAVGGGLPLREENRRLLRRLGSCIYLKAEPDTIYERVKSDTTRPLLRGEDPFERICKMLAQRNPVYESCADEILTVDEKSIEEILDEIEEMEKRGV